MADNEVENEDILSFPIIKLYPRNNKDTNKKGIDYSGDRSIEDMINFIKNNVGNKIIFDYEKKDDKKEKVADL
jgi:hypothetical protein